jgi:hypothetical protein
MVQHRNSVSISCSRHRGTELRALLDGSFPTSNKPVYGLAAKTRELQEGTAGASAKGRAGQGAKEQLQGAPAPEAKKGGWVGVVLLGM